MPEQKLIFLIGLPHSGSTIFWRAFRKNPDFLCFDEPLTASLGVHFPADNEKRTFGEYVRIFGNRPRDFWKIYRPILPIEEASKHCDGAKISYLKALCEYSRVTVIDETHLCMMVPEIARIHDNIYAIHLVRRASAFVTSHLLPSSKNKLAVPRAVIQKGRERYNRSVFFDRRDFLTGMARNEVIGSHPNSKFGLMLYDAGYDNERIMHSCTVIRLLAYWHYCYHATQGDGVRTFGNRFRMIQYENYAAAPEDTMAELYDWIGEAKPDKVNYNDVHPPRPPFLAQDKRWREYAKIAGFTETEIDKLL
ncbi:hypothetical protein [Aestuariicoccus sp. MJ-SS9]|uniref:hypothetical protein n=1 Tax=Aestuariicoccus sp. MJ-SS9 TaxID=3079855 RepID=UPI00290F05A9|nr:hypothetical protein [Aestuariicoccus sp. MJ-SS9]MDU8913522.1 hypothetical protein [Aestuariicoccus sp. MJ-SS9]